MYIEKLSLFLTGAGAGALIIAIGNYLNKSHQGSIKTKYLLWFGLAALLAGIILIINY